MSKHIEKIKKQLMEISEVVNSFRSEAVQVKVVERLLDAIMESERAEAEGEQISGKKTNKNSAQRERQYPSIRGAKKPGATKVLNQLLATDFFNRSQSISSIADYCKDNFDSQFKTSELSGILLKLANEHKLKRARSRENNRFEYVRV